MERTTGIGGTTAVSNKKSYYVGANGDSAFKGLSRAVQRTMNTALKLGGGKLFRVSTEGLFETFLSSFRDPAERQSHNCNCCHSFIRNYGGLVWLDRTGAGASAVWNPDEVADVLPPAYYRALVELKLTAEVRAVDNQYIWEPGHPAIVVGHPEAGGFSHFNLVLPSGTCPITHSPGQWAAVQRENRRHLELAFKDMKLEHIQRAVGMLESGGLNRAETLLPMGKFLLEAGHIVQNVNGEKRNRRLWHTVAHAAQGWCTPRDSAFGALVFELAEGKSVSAIVAAHNARMDPTKYQRPQAAPAAGNIDRAEKLFEKMNLAPALRRRPMALVEARPFWRPRPLPSRPSGTGLFGHLQPKDSRPPLSSMPLGSGAVTMTFVKFQRDVLPSALKIQMKVPDHGSFCGFTTAVDPEAEPIMKWDRLDSRNPGCWYLYSRGSHAINWSLQSNAYVDVPGITYLPPAWTTTDLMDYQMGGRVVVFLEGARDIRHHGSALFPECLRGELHEVRATIEAQSKSRDFEAEPRPHASGYILDAKQQPIELRVTNEVGVAHYRIDRLE